MEKRKYVAKKLVELAEKVAYNASEKASIWMHYQPKEPEEVRNKEKTSN